jgi:hypothetical protein
MAYDDLIRVANLGLPHPYQLLDLLSSPLVRAADVGWALSFARICASCGPLIGGYIAGLDVAPKSAIKNVLMRRMS